MVAERTKTEPAEGEEVEEWPVTSLEADMMAGALDDAVKKVTAERGEPRGGDGHNSSGNIWKRVPDTFLAL